MKVIKQISTGEIVYREFPFTDKTLINASNSTGIDISDLDEYTMTQQDEQQEANCARKKAILKEISELDFKTIRPIREDGIKDEVTGETWLEFYQNKIIELRNEYNNL